MIRIRTFRAFAVAMTLVVALGSAQAVAEDLKAPEFPTALSAFKKALKAPKEGGPDLAHRIAAVESLASTRDKRVFKELFKRLRSLRRDAAKQKEELDGTVEKLRKAQQSYFAWVETEYRKTGVIPGHGLKIHIDAVQTWTEKQSALAAVYNHYFRLRDAVAKGMGKHLSMLGKDRQAVWDEAVKLGSSSKDPEERASFCEALAILEGEDVASLVLEMHDREKEPEVVVALCRTLAAHPSQASFDRLVARLDSADPRVAVAAVRGLGEFRNPKLIPALIARLEKADGRLFVDLLDALFEITGKHVPDTYFAWNRWWEKDGASFLKRWHEEPAERLSELEAISMTDPRQLDIASELAALLKSERDREIRIELVNNLSLQRSHMARYRLVDVLQDDDEEVRIAAILGLAHYRHLSVPEELMRLIDKASEEEVTAIFQSLRTLWGGADEFPIPSPSKTGLHEWWDTNRGRVAGHFAKIGARGFAAGHRPPGEIEGEWRDRNFYGIRVYSQHVLFVVDLSLSMEEPAKEEGGELKKLDVAKRELKRAIKTLPEESTFGILTFSGIPEIWENGMMKATPALRKKAQTWVDELEAHAGTNIYDALEMAFELGVGGKVYRTGAPDTIYFVSDGQPTQGKFTDTAEILRHVAIWNENRGVKIHAIGVGNRQDLEFLRELAAENLGFYVYR